NTRNYEQLVNLMPGVTYGAGDQMYIGLANPSGQTNVVSFSINGQRNSANNWTLDGADNVDRGSNLTLLDYPSVDAISEFKVLRGQYSAENGRSGAGEINVVTKSGTNAFHGDAYEFFRNDKLAANNFFFNKQGTARPPLRYNDFGYTIGGPVFVPNHYNTAKDKTFFFFSQEFRRVITYGGVTATVPTSAELQGTFASPVCVAFSPSTGCTATATQITTVDPTAAAYVKDIWSKVPTSTNAARTVFNPLRNIFNGRQEILRIDQTFSPKFSVFFRYINDSIPTQEPGGLFTGAALPGVATTSTNAPGHTYLGHATYAISPSVLNEAAYSYSYGAIISNPIGTISSLNSPDIQVNLPFVSTLTRVPGVSLSGGSGIAGFGPYRDFNRDHNVYDNLTWIHGLHTMRFGVSYHHYQKTENNGGPNTGSFSFAPFVATGGVSETPAGTPTFDQSWANFLLGQDSNFSQASEDVTPDIRTNQWEFYAQDSYRVRPNLTLEYGVRYSIFRQPIDHNNQMDNFDPLAFVAPPSGHSYVIPFDPTQPSTSTQNKEAGLLCAADPTVTTACTSAIPLNGIIVGGGISPFGNKVSGEDMTDLAPRIGLAWDPFGTGKTSIRAGYGIFYDSTLFGTFEQNIFANPPFVQSVSFSNTTFAKPTISGQQNVSFSPLALHGTPLPFHTPYVQDWSFDVQRMLPHDLLVDVGYYGNKGTHLLGIADLNAVRPGLAASLGYPTITRSNVAILNSLRPFPGYNAINTLETEFDSNYNSLQIAAQKKFGTGSLLQFNYTYSHALTDNQSDRSTAPQNPYNLHAEYGPSQLDRTQVFTVDYVYDLPFYRAQEGVLGHTLGGWEVSGIVTYYTGLPLTVTTLSGVDPGGLGYFGPSAAGGRPDRVGNPSSGAPHTINQWFNTAAFADVPAGTVRPGNSPRGAVRGPGVGVWDFDLFKNLKLTERFNMQLRGEFFNLFNHTNPDGISTSLGSSSYGKVLSARDPRIIQLGLKFYY
ncbi:MAG: TonB-dependent receptor domain-containing protein, partial [Candidatus Acidiferrales bacterium]